MASSKSFCDETKDRISELPLNVIDCIFERMPIRDATRTSLLSRKWRYSWASFPQLVFDVHFFKEIYIKHQQFIQYEFPKAINKAFLVHNGPILKFFLQIPNISNDLNPEIDHWMLFLSRNGIKELELRNSNPTPYNLPSCIFYCNTLIDLKLNNCTLKPPNAFGGFHYLVKLKLVKVSFSASMSATLLHNAPVLRWVAFKYCTGIEHRSINAPNLTYLCMVKSDKVDWQWFKRKQRLRTVKVELCKGVENVERTVNVMRLLKNMRRVKTLWLNGFSLKFLAAGDPPQSLPTPRRLVPTPSLTFIRLRDFGVDDVDQISSALCLLRSCPNLKVAALKENVTEPFISYLEPSNCKNMKLDMLETVKIRPVKGLKAELLFIKLLLARSTYLQRMIIEQSNSIGASDGLKISREVLRFSRASSRAELYVDPVQLIIEFLIFWIGQYKGRCQLDLTLSSF